MAYRQFPPLASRCIHAANANEAGADAPASQAIGLVKLSEPLLAAQAVG